jgi:hypothetical protein
LPTDHVGREVMAKGFEVEVLEVAIDHELRPLLAPMTIHSFEDEPKHARGTV